MTSGRGSHKRHSAFSLFAAVCVVVSCAHAEESFDQESSPRSASGTRGGASSAGRSGAAGNAPSAGSPARGGSSGGGSGGSGNGAGNGGAAESGGSDEVAGGADSAGGAGDGGSSVGAGGMAPDPVGCAESPSARVQYKVLRSDSVVQFQMRFYNEGATALALDQCEFSYYFSNEEDSMWNTYVDDASTNGGADGYVALQGATKVTVEPVAPGVTGATHRARIVIDSPTVLEDVDVGLLTIRLEPTSYEQPHQLQADDYSFDASKTELMDWERITLLAQGDLAWGCVPQAP